MDFERILKRQYFLFTSSSSLCVNTFFKKIWTKRGNSDHSGHNDISRFWAIFDACKFFVNKWKRVA
jgi:hypothetical protein